MRLSATDAAYVLRMNERSVRAAIASGRLPAVKTGKDWAIDPEDLSRVPGWTVDRQRLREMERQEARSQEALLDRVEALEREVSSLRALVLSRARYDGQEATPDASQVSSISRAPMPAYVPLNVPDSDAFPASIRGRARWVEEHGGPGQTWVRDWPGVKRWNGPEDAIASVRAHKGWENWTPAR